MKEKIFGPYATNMLIYITEIDQRPGFKNGIVTLQMPLGCPITPETADLHVREFERVNMPEGYRLMTKQEAFDFYIQERTGVNGSWAVPNGSNFDVPPKDPWRVGMFIKNPKDWVMEIIEIDGKVAVLEFEDKSKIRLLFDQLGAPENQYTRCLAPIARGDDDGELG